MQLKGREEGLRAPLRDTRSGNMILFSTIAANLFLLHLYIFI